MCLSYDVENKTKNHRFRLNASVCFLWFFLAAGMISDSLSIHFAVIFAEDLSE